MTSESITAGYRVTHRDDMETAIAHAFKDKCPRSEDQNCRRGRVYVLDEIGRLVNRRPTAAGYASPAIGKKQEEVEAAT
jgi:hypothetical protein